MSAFPNTSRALSRIRWNIVCWLLCDCRKNGVLSSTGGRCDSCGRRVLGCQRPPRGWWCSLWAGHDGPCPTWPCWWNLRGIDMGGLSIGQVLRERRLRRRAAYMEVDQ